MKFWNYANYNWWGWINDSKQAPLLLPITINIVILSVVEVRNS